MKTAVLLAITGISLSAWVLWNKSTYASGSCQGVVITNTALTTAQEDVFLARADLLESGNKICQLLKCSPCAPLTVNGRTHQ